MATRPAALARLHLGVVSPWRKAVSALFGDGRADFGDLQWELPENCEPGDSVLHVVCSPQPTIIEWDFVEAGPGGSDDVEFDCTRFYPDGVSLAAVERRLGFSLPTPPGTVDPARVGEVERAVAAEEADPTSWRLLGPVRCDDPMFDNDQPAPDYGCPGCDDDEVTLERHVVDFDDETGGGRTVFVCSRCHDRFHTPVPPSLADVVGTGRPPCPSCSAQHTLKVIWGFPPGPPPPGYEVAGCIIPDVPEDYACGDCAFSWAEDDARFPLVTDPAQYGRVRARIDSTTPHPESEHIELRQPGRLVVGRYEPSVPHGSVAPAWGDSGVRHLLMGEDRRLYEVDPQTVRLTEPAIPSLGGIHSPRIVDRAGIELFAALESPTGEVTLSSPFLTLGIATRLAALARRSTVDWYLLTRLDARAVANGVLTVEGLRRLLAAGVAIADCPGLHGKAYVVGQSFAMVGSANLTNAGLGESRTPNAELSVVVPRAEVAGVQEVLDEWWDASRYVGEEDLVELEERAEHLPKPPPRPPSRGGTHEDPGLEAVVEQLLADARADGVTLWAKAQYGDADPSAWQPEGWFSTGGRGTPKFAPGDLVLIYAQDEHGIYGVVEVLDEPTYDPREEQWPWVNRATPRLMPDPLVLVAPEELGLDTRPLQAGRMRLGLAEFAAGVGAIADAHQAQAEMGED